MADQFIGIPIDVDETDLYNIGVARIQQDYPSWQPSGFADLILRVVASMAAVGADIASTVDMSIFQAFGSLANKLPLPATPATASATFTMQDNAGYTVPSQTPVGLLTSGMTDPIGFWTTEDFDIPNGSTSASIDLVAIVPGSGAAGLDTVVRTDSLSFVTGIVLDAPSEGGQDAQTTQDYLDFLSRDFENWTTTPIRGKNFATSAQEVAGVYRAAWWENYNPADSTTNNEKYVALSCIDAAGIPVSSGIKTAVQDHIEALREVNFVAPIVDATRNDVDVSCDIYVEDTTNSSQDQADVTAALQSFMSPATWGMPQPIGRPLPIWINTPVIRLNSLIAAISRVPDVVYTGNVRIGAHGGSRSAADYNMTGAFPLANLVTATINVNAA